MLEVKKKERMKGNMGKEQEQTHKHTNQHSKEEIAHLHKHVHSEEEKKKVVNRIAKAIGHMEAVKQMVLRDEDCTDVLIQLAAVRAEINSTGKVVLQNHVNHCIVEAVEEGDMEAIEKLNQAINMFVK